MFWTPLLAAVAVVAAVPSLELPIPEQYMGDRTAIVQFMPLSEIEKHCGKPTNPKFKRYGCASIGQPYMWVINPCDFQESVIPGTYAHYLCHELAHTNGWVHD